MAVRRVKCAFGATLVELLVVAARRPLADDPAQPACVRGLCHSLDRVREGVHGRWRESLRDTHAAPRR